MIFWILTTPRSGSNYITGEIWRRLGGEPKPMEYFNSESVACRPDFTPDPAAPVRSYLDYLAAREGVRGMLAVKMLWIQVQACCRYADFLSEIAGRKIVCLRRRDVIRQGISLFILLQTGAWASGVAPRRLRFEDVAYDYEAIASRVARMELHNALLDRFLATFGLDHLSVWYEDFVAAPDAEAARVLAYLGLDQAAGPLPQAAVFARQSTGLDEAFYERFLADERARLSGDGTFHGPPLFSAAASESQAPPARPSN
jgi:LPS sulfotransferase NodH